MCWLTRSDLSSSLRAHYLFLDHFVQVPNVVLGLKLTPPPEKPKTLAKYTVLESIHVILLAPSAKREPAELLHVVGRA
jgi:hypothetical protein